jgi:hypothetical protein
VNPYGFGLHKHIVAYLRSDWIRTVVDEFKAPSFRSEQLAQFEILLIAALVFTGVLIGRRRFVHALWFAAIAHLSLTSVRHVPVFIAVAAPILAELITGVWAGLAARMHPMSAIRILDRIASDIEPGFRRTSVWPALFLLTLAGTGAWVKWPADFPAARFPTALIQSHQSLLVASRVLTLDQWGDYLIYKNYPRQRVFADGRSDFLGPEIGDEYLRVSGGHYRWSEILDRFGVDTILAPVSWPLSTILKTARGWTVLADDGRAILFHRDVTPSHPARP